MFQSERFFPPAAHVLDAPCGVGCHSFDGTPFSLDTPRLLMVARK